MPEKTLPPNSHGLASSSGRLRPRDSSRNKVLAVSRTMNSDKRAIDGYIALLSEIMNRLDRHSLVEIASIIRTAYNEERMIFTLGNGGSASTASHLACDLNKGACFGAEKRFRVIALTDSQPIILALANDVSYNDIFVEQLRNFAREGDVVIGISGSGNSTNVLKAIDYARTRGCTTIGFCGFDGGSLRKLADHTLHVPIDDMQITEDVHLVASHILTRVLTVETAQVSDTPQK